MFATISVFSVGLVLGSLVAVIMLLWTMRGPRFSRCVCCSQLVNPEFGHDCPNIPR